MKLKDNFELRDVCGEKVLISCGEANVDFSKIVALNDTAAFLWEEAKKMEEFTVESLTKVLCDNYEVEPARAETDVKEVIEKWREIDLVA